MGDTISEIRDDIAEYRALCERFTELVRRDNVGLPDCYGPHAKKLKARAAGIAGAQLTDSERAFATGDFNGDEPPHLASFSFDDVIEFANAAGITFEAMRGALLDIAAAWERATEATSKLRARQAEALTK